MGSILAVILALACDRQREEAPKAEAPAAPSSAAPSQEAPGQAAAAAEPSGEEPGPTVQATPKTEVEPTPDPAAPVAPASGKPGEPAFTRALVAERARLHAMADGGLLVSVGPQIYVVDGGGTLAYDPSLLQGLPAPLSPDPGGDPLDWHWDLDVTGKWPDAVFASYWVAPPPNTPHVVRPTFRLRDGRFEPLALGGDDHSFHYVDARPYVDGSILALRRYQALPPPGVMLSECHEDDPATVRRCEARVAKVRRKAEASKSLVVIRGLPKGPDLAKGLGHPPPPLAAFDSLASGHVFAATEEERARVLVHAPGGTTALMQLPGGRPKGSMDEPLRIVAVRALASDAVLAAGVQGDYDGAARLFRYDGRTWTEEPAPPCGESTELRHVEQLSSGERFALCVELPEEEDGFPARALPVWWQRPGGEWAELPQRGMVLARHGEHVWVADEAGVFTTAPVTAERTAPSRDALDRTLLEKGPPTLALDRTW